jgi:hypothetical protein
MQLPLSADHILVRKILAEYRKALSPSKKKQLVDQIFTELAVHAQIEVEIVYLQCGFGQFPVVAQGIHLGVDAGYRGQSCQFGVNQIRP